MRTLQPPHEGCDVEGMPTGYTPTDLSMLGVHGASFEDTCGTLRLHAISDACGARVAEFDGFRGTRH